MGRAGGSVRALQGRWPGFVFSPGRLRPLQSLSFTLLLLLSLLLLWLLWLLLWLLLLLPLQSLSLTSWSDIDRLCIFLSPLDGFLDSFARTLLCGTSGCNENCAGRDHHLRIDGATLAIFLRRLIRCTVFAF